METLLAIKKVGDSVTKKSIIIISIFCSFILAGSLLYFYINEKNSEQIEKNFINKQTKDIQMQNENTLVTSSKEDIVVSPKAKLIKRKYYKKCGHIVEDEFDVEKNIVNMNKEELAKYFFEWKIEEFSENKIIIYKEIADICEEHYIVKDVNGNVNIYRKDENENEVWIKSTELLTKYLPAEDYNKLKNGINIIGKENLLELLQDLE